MYATNLLCQICVTLPPPYKLPWPTRISTQIHDGSCTEDSTHYTLNRDVWHYLGQTILYYHPLCHFSVTLPPNYSDPLQFHCRITLVVNFKLQLWRLTYWSNFMLSPFHLLCHYLSSSEGVWLSTTGQEWILFGQIVFLQLLPRRPALPTAATSVTVWSSLFLWASPRPLGITPDGQRSERLSEDYEVPTTLHAVTVSCLGLYPITGLSRTQQLIGT